MVKRKTYAPVPGQHISGQANKPLSQPPHSLTSQQVLDELCSNSATGLRPEEVPQRLEEMGPNELEQKAGVQPVKIFVEQIFNAMTLVRDL
jgi:P-type Na+/K+ transporter